MFNNPKILSWIEMPMRITMKTLPHKNNFFCVILLTNKTTDR